MRIYIASVLVDDVARAHDFYVNTLGFKVKDDVTHGDFRWLTGTNASDPADGSGIELLLEPKGHPAAALLPRHSKRRYSVYPVPV